MKKKIKSGLGKRWAIVIGVFLVLLIVAAVTLFLREEPQKSANSNVAPAASGTGSITAIPEKTTVGVGEEFNVAMVISGGGQSYTSFKAGVTLTNLTAKSIDAIQGPATEAEFNALPPGEFMSWAMSFGEPRISNGTITGFAGGVKNNRTEDLTIYTVTLVATNSGTASINVNNGEVNQIDGSNSINLFTAGSSTTSITVGSAVNPCENNIQDGEETGVDCGGTCPNSCPPPPPPLCGNGVKDAGEQDVDCGGTCAKTCPPPPATCYDNSKNGNETGVDCGGSDCVACQKLPTCSDGIKNGKETGVDCGGTCKACKVTTNNTTPKSKPPVQTPATPVNVIEALVKANSDSEFRTTWDKVQITKSFILDFEPPAAVSAKTTSSALAGIVFSGKAFAGTTVHLFVFSTPIHKEVVADSGNNWKITFDEPLSTGSHNVYAALVKDGSTTRSEKVQAITVDAAQGTVKPGTSTTVAETPVDETSSDVVSTDTTVDSQKYIMYGGIALAVIVVIALIAYFVTKKKKEAEYLGSEASSGSSGSASSPNFFPEAGNAVDANTQPTTPNYAEPVQPEQPSQQQPVETQAQPAEETLITSDPLAPSQNLSPQSDSQSVQPSTQPTPTAPSSDYQFGHYDQPNTTQPNSDEPDQTQVPK